MKRRSCLCLMILPALLTGAGALGKPAAARSNASVPRELVSPELFDGFDLISPDASGISPSGQFLVLQDNLGLRILRARNSAELFRTQVADFATIGFDQADRRLYILESFGGGFRLRFINPATGVVLLDQRFSDRPDIRTDFNGSVTVVTTRNGDRAQTLVFNSRGQITYRRSSSSFVQVAINPSTPIVAFLERSFADSGTIELVNAASGRITTRVSFYGQFVAGFEPSGADFVFAQSTSTSSFRVTLFNAASGQPLVNQSFFGAFNVGFTSNSRFLGVVARDGSQTRVSFYRTLDGKPVSP